MPKSKKKTDKPFRGSSKQETQELRTDLASPNKDKVKGALRRVISLHVSGADVSQYFENMVSVPVPFWLVLTLYLCATGSGSSTAPHGAEEVGLLVSGAVCTFER